MKGFFMPVKLTATRQVYFPLLELKRKESGSPKTLIHAFPYKNRPRVVQNDTGFIFLLIFCTLIKSFTMSENQNPDNEQQQPSENVISDYYDGVKQLEMEGHRTGIKKARNALFITAGLFLIWEAIAIGQTGVSLSMLPPAFIVIVVAEVGSFVGLALWTKTKPYTAIIVGIILFILLWVAAIVLVGGRAIYGGIIIRIIILVNLISALKPAKAWEDLKKNG